MLPTPEWFIRSRRDHFYQTEFAAVLAKTGPPLEAQAQVSHDWDFDHNPNCIPHSGPYHQEGSDPDEPRLEAGPCNHDDRYEHQHDDHQDECRS